MIKILSLFLLVNISCFAELSLERERELVREGLQKLVIENTERFLKTELDADDLERIKDLVEIYESNFYANYLSSFKISSCNAKMGVPDLLVSKSHHFQNNNTAFVDERNAENIQVDASDYSPVTSMRYRNIFYHYANQIEMLGYSKETKNITNIKLDSSLRIFAIDPVTGAEIPLRGEDTYALHKEFLRQLYVGIHGKEREEAIGDPEVPIQFFATAPRSYNPLQWFQYTQSVVDGGLIARTLRRLNPLNYRLSALTRQVNARINTRNAIDIVDNFGNKYVVKFSFFGKELVVPRHWQKFQPTMFVSSEQINRVELKDFPFDIDSDSVSFSSILLIQNFYQIFDYENYKEKSKYPLREVRVFYSTPAPQRNICIAKKVVLDLYENLNSSCKDDLVKVDLFKRKLEQETILFSTEINRIFENVSDGNFNLEEICAKLENLKHCEIEKKNTFKNIVASFENSGADTDFDLIEIINTLIRNHEVNLTDLKQKICHLKRYENNGSLLRHYVAAIRERYWNNFEAAEQALGQLDKAKKLFPAVKAESSFTKADRLAYTRVDSSKEQTVLRAQYRKAVYLNNQTEKYILQNFAAILADDPEVDCVINEDDEGNLTYYFKDQDQVIVDYALKYTSNVRRRW